MAKAQWKPLEKLPAMIAEADIYMSADWELASMLKARPRLIKLRFTNGTEHVWHQPVAKGPWRLRHVWIKPHMGQQAKADPMALKPTRGAALMAMTREMTKEESQARLQLWAGFIYESERATKTTEIQRAWRKYLLALVKSGFVQTNSGYRVMAIS